MLINYINKEEMYPCPNQSVIKSVYILIFDVKKLD